MIKTKLVFNGRFLTRPQSGVDRVAYALLTEILKMKAVGELNQLELCLALPKTETAPPLDGVFGAGSAAAMRKYCLDDVLNGSCNSEVWSRDNAVRVIEFYNR